MTRKIAVATLALSLAVGSGLAAQAKPNAQKPAPTHAATAPAPATGQSHAAAMASPKTVPLDINSATRSQLIALPGVGEMYADKVIKGRPYATKNQLLSKRVLPATVYSKVEGLIVATQTPKSK